MDFTTTDVNDKGEPYMKGIFKDLRDIDEDFQDEEIMKLVREYRKKNDKFKPPYVVMDLAPPEGVKIKVEGEEEEHQFTELVREQDDFVKLIASVPQLVDCSNIANPFAQSIVKVNQAVPVYRWFIAANMWLQFTEQPGRVIPFPISAPPGEGETEPRYVYHMFVVTPKEYMKYSYALKHATSVSKTFEESFEVSARIAFEILAERGLSELDHERVDKVITHVHVGQNKGILDGVLLHNCSSDGLRDSDELKTNNIFY